MRRSQWVGIVTVLQAGSLILARIQMQSARREVAALCSSVCHLIGWTVQHFGAGEKTIGIINNYYVSQNEPVYSAAGCSAELTDTLVSSEHMQSLMTLLKAKRSAGKLFKSSRAHLVRTRQSPPWPTTRTVHYRLTRICSYTCCTCCAELSHQNNLNNTTIGELLASHEPHPCLSPS